MQKTPIRIGKDPLPTLKQIRDAIPKHCFQRSTLRSLLYPLRDILLLTLIGYTASNYIPFELSFISIILWIIYAYIQGSVGLSIFVIGHECGHGAFSDYQIINDIVGYITHTILLVPYFSWKRTHFVHHSKNNHLLDNQSHQPNLMKTGNNMYKTVYNILGQLGFFIISMLVYSVFGWLAYIFLHRSGSRRNPYIKQDYKSIPNHFSPFQNNQLFSKQMRPKIAISTIGVIIVASCLLILGYNFGFKQLCLLYFGPYVVTFSWLVILTWLHHTQPTVPHLGQDEWSWLRGALMTVDRNYHWIFDHLHHRIGTTHVLHHIFPQIPHYHAVEASNAIIPVLGDHYKYDPTPIYKVIWRLANQCHFVQEISGVQFYKSFTSTKEI